MDYRIEVYWNTHVPDGRAEAVLADLPLLDVPPVESVRVNDLYFVRGDLSAEDVDLLCHELLVDSVVQGFRVSGFGSQVAPPQSPPRVPKTGACWGGGRSNHPTTQSSNPPTHPSTIIEVGFHPGVTDSVAENLVLGAGRLGVAVEQAATGTQYALTGALSEADARRIATGLLCNEVIQGYTLGDLEADPRSAPFAPPAMPSDVVEMIPMREMEDEELERMSTERVLFLDLAEMRAIRTYYRQEGRDPTDVELETLAQTWSEHCVHKTFKALIDYECRDPSATRQVGGARVPEAACQQIDGLLKTYIRTPTEQLARPWVRSAFVDNAGILALDEAWDVSFKVETHNHPSALEPFGGANTGVGGVVRDVIGVSARPIANTDVLCFGPPDLPLDQVPAGALHPRRIAAGVIAGIEDYGNKMGIPTVNGAILYDPGYTGNPLVFCGCVGIAPRDSHRSDARAGDLCISVGGRTGRDGLHGATFSSAELTHETGETVGSVVQIGNPITEKTFLEAVLVARDEGLYTAITDCGAGGFSSAVGEMGRAVGVEIDLALAPLKYPGLRPWEIWLSEAQERMILAVPPERLERLGQICAVRDVELTVIGRFTGDGRLTLRYGDRVVGSMDMEFLHDGIPRRRLQAVWEGKRGPGSGGFGNSGLGQVGQLPCRFPSFASDRGSVPPLKEILLRLLAWPNIASKEDVIRRYDHEVQGGTVVKPLTGAQNDGPSDASVIRPLSGKNPQDRSTGVGQARASVRGLAIGCGINPRYGQIDPYAMAWAAVDEAMRNVVAVGADPDGVALLDNFCWGNPNVPDRLGGLVRAAQGCHDAALHYGAPFVSGKDSLNNEYVDPAGRATPIPPTLLVSALGFVPDVRRAVTMDLKAAGDRLYIVGETRAELGGSAYSALSYSALGPASVPAPAPASIDTMRALHRAIGKGYVRACHDCSEGGLAVAAAEMAFAGGLGLTLRLAGLPRAPEDALEDAVALFSESSGRFLVEVTGANAAAFEAEMDGLVWARLGRTGGDTLHVIGTDGQTAIEAGLNELKAAWQGGHVVHR
jgi:phosphoribosylformylglycinamidine (FGAM) synthase-like enzyme/phosphoribosylformylglycinamidine (FGAM) synthase PurS component